MTTSTSPAKSPATTATTTHQEPLADVAVIRQRPRSVAGEEAYLRSEREQAAIDIAAGR